MAIFKYLVTVDAASQSDANDVMSVRCGCDEEVEATDGGGDPTGRWVEYVLWYEEVPDDQAG